MMYFLTLLICFAHMKKYCYLSLLKDVHISVVVAVPIMSALPGQVRSLLILVISVYARNTLGGVNRICDL